MILHDLINKEQFHAKHGNPWLGKKKKRERIRMHNYIKENTQPYVCSERLIEKYRYLSVKSFSLVAIDPNKSTENRYSPEVLRVAASVPTGIERWVSFNEAERFEPAMIPVTAGKNRPTNALKWWKVV